jgi:hypothetical protein
MEKIDLTKTLKPFYTAPPIPQLITVGKGTFITIDGQGDPNASPFTERVQALYTTAYSIKNLFKLAGKDFTVCKLEGLWWVEDQRLWETGATNPQSIPRSEWRWQVMIRIPDYVSNSHFQQAISKAIDKKGMDLLHNVGFKQWEEGKCVQVMHTGPYATEAFTLGLMHDFIQQMALTPQGRHHEIYISDPRKSAPEKMKTILRQPVK